MNEFNYWKELKATFKHFSIWAVRSLLEGLFLAFWFIIQWVLNKIITPFKLNGIDQVIYPIFQIIFFIYSLAQVAIMMFRDIKNQMLRTNYDTSEEINKDRIINQIKIGRKEQIGYKLRRTIQLIIPSLGAFIASVFIIISIFLYKFSYYNKSIENINLLLYLILPAFLIFYSIFTTKKSNNSINYWIKQIIKRLVDVIWTVIALFFMLPILILISIAIKIDSRGPIIYSSKRIGQFGVLFDYYIFRTIYTDNKITRIGKFLRRTSLDELPAFYNVLVGEMSLIGPRPRLPIHLRNDLDFEKQILLVKPGITGLSQIRIASILSYQEIILLDLDYVKKWSLLLDAKIFFKTIPVVLLGYRK